MFEKRKKYLKHTREYQKELFKMPTFWIGVVLLVSGMILVGLNQHITITSPLIGLGFIFTIASKYRVMGRIEERYNIK
jgi:hypothetical protein